MFKAGFIALIFIISGLSAFAQAPVFVPDTPTPVPTAMPAATPIPEVKPPVLTGDTAQGKPPVLKVADGGPQIVNQPVPKPTVKPDDEVIKVETNLITTPVSVLDRNGRFIAGLKKKDFQVFDNGVAQEISYFQSSEQPFTVILMLDVSPSTKYKIDDIHYAALTFINQLRPTDKVLVVAFDQRIRLLTPEPTSDKTILTAAIYKATVGSGTSVYEAVRWVTEMDLVKATGRKAIVIFSDGVDTTSRQNFATYESTVAGVQEIDALVYPIHYNTMADVGATGGVINSTTGASVALPPDIAKMLAERGLALDPRTLASMRGMARGTSPSEHARGLSYLTRLSENSGGRIFEAVDIKNLEGSFAGIAEELRRQYSIGYYPEAEGQPGERRSLKIKVTRPNVVVRAKNGYVIRQMRGDLAGPAKSGLLAGK